MKKLIQITVLLIYLIAASAFAQQPTGTLSGSGTLTGSVTLSGSLQPLQFVNLAVKGTTIGATTDKDGRFEMKIPADTNLVIL